VETPSTSYFQMIVQLGPRALGDRYYAGQEVVTDVGIENDTADAIGLFRKCENFRCLFSHLYENWALMEDFTSFGLACFSP
jgi:hypothetical protein